MLSFASNSCSDLAPGPCMGMELGPGSARPALGTWSPEHRELLQEGKGEFSSIPVSPTLGEGCGASPSLTESK